MDEKNFQKSQTKSKRNPPKSGLDDPEVAAMFKRMHEMSRDLKEKLDYVHEKGKSSNFDVDRFMDYAYKSSSKEIESIIAKEKEIRENIEKVIPEEACVKKPEKSNQKMTQERKGKTRGIRKNWIPMK